MGAFWGRVTRVAGVAALFREENRVLTFGAFATIFGWIFVQTLNKHLFTPLIKAFVIKKKNWVTKQHLPRDEVIDWPNIIAQTVQFVVSLSIVFTLYLLWIHLFGKSKSDTSDAPIMEPIDTPWDNTS